MRHVTTRTSLNLEIQAPQLRLEAFPWGSANVEIRAAFVIQACRHVISLPGMINLSALLFPGEELDGRSEPAETLDVEVIGYDNGVTFVLGNASIPLPPTMQPVSISDHQFRVCLSGEEGVRNGTLVGVVRSHSPASEEPGVDEAIGVRLLPSCLGSAVVKIQDKIVGEAAGVRESENGMMTAEDASKVDHQTFEHEAIQLLEAATKILASPRSCVGGRARPSDDPTATRVAAHKSTDELGSEGGLRKRQALEEPWTDVSGDINASTLDFTLDSAPPSKKEDEVLLPPRFPTAGFKFEPTTGNVEWHKIVSVNVSKVEAEGDLQTLKQFLPEVTVGMVDEEDVDASPGLVSAFRLAQLQTQYVLHCSQLLKRQCDGLGTTVASMELEIKGNSQGSTAKKNRARLLRKESRKQDKIINGYAAMLRTHNPILSSKVFLDEKGRLKVVKAHKATRRREHGRRRRKRRNRGCRDHESDNTLAGGTVNNNGSQSSTDTEGPRSGSGVPSPGDNSSSLRSEAGGPAPRLGSLRPRSYTETTATPVPEDQEGVFHLGAGEESKAAPSEQGRGGTAVVVAGQDRALIGMGASGGEPVMPRGRRREISNVEAGGRARVDDADGGHVVQVLPRGGDTSALLSFGEHNRTEEDAPSVRGSGTRKSPAGTLELRGPGIDTHSIARPGIGMLAPDSVEWAGAGSDDHTSKSGKPRARSVSKGGETSSSDEQAPSAGGQRKSLGLTPRMVTVSVKPKSNRRPASASSQEGSRSASPQRQNPRAEGTNNTTITGSGTNQPEVPVRLDDHGIASSEASPLARKLAAAHCEITGDSIRGQPPSPAGGRVKVEETSLGKHFCVSNGGATEGVETSVPGLSSPVVAASRLGLDGDGFPDVSEFDLDDISEINVGEDWAGDAGGESLSS